MLEHFVAGTPARAAAELAGVNRNTARLFYHRLREIIAQQLAQASPFLGELEIDEPWLRGAPRPAPERAASGKVPVFGLLKRGGWIHTVAVPGAAREAPPGPKIRVRPDAVVYAGAPALRQVLDVSGFRHERLRVRTRVLRGRARIDRIENFWNQAKRHLHRYNGIPRQHLRLFLKECEWRFNCGSPGRLLNILKHWIKTGAARSSSMPVPGARRPFRKIA